MNFPAQEVLKARMVGHVARRRDLTGIWGRRGLTGPRIFLPI